MSNTNLKSVCLLIGGNLGNRLENLTKSKRFIEQYLGFIQVNSSIYETAAWGFAGQPDFLNQVIIVNTLLSPIQCLEQILLIENRLGRIRTQKNAPRIIDIDILFYDDVVLNIPGLIIPHPEIQNRRFVLTPLNEISSSFEHPVLQKTIQSLLAACMDKLDVKRIIPDPHSSEI